MFTAFWMAAWRFRDSAGKVGGSLSSILDARLAIANLQEFFALHPRMMTAGTLTPPLRGAVSLRNVSFRYTDQSVPVLEDITLDLRPGEIVALVGPNGAGKSTLAKLIARLYAPTDGDILIDGTPLEAIRLDHYYRHLALVPQTPPRFEATAGENIAFGNWDELQQAPDRIRQIAAIAGADRLIQQLPDGLDTMLGRMFGDHDLSGGQWKKLSLARALAGDPRIVILDEPAANLDIQTERLMHQQLKQVLAGRTTILISHHFSSVLMADRIVVLVDGRLVEQGTHAELQAAGGVYASMCQTHRELTHEPSESNAPSPSMSPLPGGTPPSGQQAA
jgi:ATP-binding cassette, subfamily B, bacterial